MRNASIMQAGAMVDWLKPRFRHPTLGKEADGKLFLREALGLTSAEISLNCFPPGRAMPFFHKHREHEEIYLFLTGEGRFQVDDEVFEIKPGTAIRVSPQGARSYRNDSQEPMHFIVIQARHDSVSSGTIHDGEIVRRKAVWEG